MSSHISILANLFAQTDFDRLNKRVHIEVTSVEVISETLEFFFCWPAPWCEAFVCIKGKAMNHRTLPASLWRDARLLKCIWVLNARLILSLYSAYTQLILSLLN